MLFNSWQFLLFFPVVTGLYFALPYRARMGMLLAASAVFYMALIPSYILILLFTIVVDYYAGLYISRAQGARRRAGLVASLIANVGVLGFFKYYGFLTSNLNITLTWLHLSWALPTLSIVLPVGLSFHTFQAMSYTIEVYRGRQKAERDFLIYALYVMFYPQLVAGPIERPQNILHQLHEDHAFDYDRVVAGLRRMLFGFFKKVFIADRLAVLVGQVYGHPSEYHAPALLLATYAFTFQIYCDFSGYSDIAIGTAQVMGIRLMKNFNQPYSATSIGDFWARWHISLSTWFRDYLYIPLGGNRVSAARRAWNITVVFLVSGLWHGANWTFVLWGAIHAFYMLAGLVLARPLALIDRLLGPGLAKAVKRFSVFQLVAFAWIFFRAPSIGEAWAVVRGIFGSGLGPEVELHRLGLGPFEVLLGAFGVGVLLVAEALNRDGRIETGFARYPAWARWGCYYATAALILALGKFSQLQFLYFQF